MRVWSDTLDRDGTIGADIDIVREHWKYGLSAQQVIALDHKIVNCNLDMLYYTPPDHYPDTRRIYEIFEPYHFQDGAIPAKHPLHLGVKLQFWGDHAAKLDLSEEEIEGGLYEPLRALAQKGWGSMKFTESYHDFQRIIEQCGHAPGYDR